MANEGQIAVVILKINQSKEKDSLSIFPHNHKKLKTVITSLTV